MSNYYKMFILKIMSLYKSINCLLLQFWLSTMVYERKKAPDAIYLKLIHK